MAPTLRIELNAHLPHLEQVLDDFNQFAGRHRIPVPIRRDAHVALDEIVSNVIRYGATGQRPCRICVEVTLLNGALRIQVIDNGRPFDPLTVPEPSTTVSPHQRAVGGLGIYVVKKLMDRMEYTRCNGRNRLTMFRLFKKRR